MAKGRMIVKEISYDARIWGMSDRARMLFPYCLPHIETDGTLPRNSRALRGMCFPFAQLTDQDVESVILEWIASKVCLSIDGRLRFPDFEECNASLDFVRKRLKKREVPESTLQPDISGKSEDSGNSGKSSEVKGSEVKGSEKKTTTSFVCDPGLGVYSKEFTDWWTMYPACVNRGSKAAAVVAWNAAMASGASPSVLLEALGRHKKTEKWTKDGGQYVPAASKWLTERRWEIEVISPPSAPERPVEKPCPKCGLRGGDVKPVYLSKDGKTKICSMCKSLENE